MNEFLNSKVMPAFMKFINSRVILSIKDGLLLVMPLTIIGSIFLLLAQLPWKPASDFVTNLGLNDSLFQAFGATFGIMALVATMGIAYAYVKGEGFVPMPAAIIALCSFILTLNASATDAASGVVIGNVINKAWCGGQGMVTAILIGLFTGAVYTWFLKRNIRIKMPNGVPAGVANAFTALIPGAFIITIVTIVYTICAKNGTTFTEFIYKVIQIPLQGATDSVGGVLVMAFCIPFFWWFGIHGSAVVSGIMSGILQSNTVDNQNIIQAGKELTRANGAHIVTQQFLDNFVAMTGAGITIGIVIYMVALAKSKQCKELGKLALIPALFNINEPILFAAPIVLNPFMFVPFVILPVITGLSLYGAMYIGLVPLFTGVSIPWTTPPIISGFILGGWRTALFQAIVLSMSILVYLPFVRQIDKMNLKAEESAEE